MRVEADALEPVFPVTATGLIDGVRIGEQPNVVIVALSRQAGTARTTIATADNTTRVAIEIPVAESRVPTPGSTIPTTDPRLPASESSRLPGLEPRQALQTLAIDPGHGGDEVGVRGGGGLEEKQLTLDVARRLRSLVERGLGVRVILTRDDDRIVGIDERAAAANNGKADLLLSIHANGALSGSPTGAEVFYERLDREGEAVRRSLAAGAISLPVVGGGTRSIEVVPWDLAQARHIDASAMLASVLEQELRQRVPMGQRPIQQGPMRLLSAANMPAALVEMAYLTNNAQEKAAAGEEFKNAVAQALYNAIVRFRGYLEETSAP
jgi:N-acetylmuramoyl-L-alanine amidase